MITVNDNDGRFEPIHIPERKPLLDDRDSFCGFKKDEIIFAFDEEGSAFAKSLRE